MKQGEKKRTPQQELQDGIIKNKETLRILEEKKKRSQEALHPFIDAAIESTKAAIKRGEQLLKGN